MFVKLDKTMYLVGAFLTWLVNREKIFFTESTFTKILPKGVKNDYNFVYDVKHKRYLSVYRSVRCGNISSGISTKRSGIV